MRVSKRDLSEMTSTALFSKRLNPNRQTPLQIFSFWLEDIKLSFESNDVWVFVSFVFSDFFRFYKKKYLTFETL